MPHVEGHGVVKSVHPIGALLSGLSTNFRRILEARMLRDQQEAAASQRETENDRATQLLKLQQAQLDETRTHNRNTEDIQRNRPVPGSKPPKEGALPADWTSEQKRLHQQIEAQIGRNYAIQASALQQRVVDGDPEASAQLLTLNEIRAEREDLLFRSINDKFVNNFQDWNAFLAQLEGGGEPIPQEPKINPNPRVSTHTQSPTSQKGKRPKNTFEFDPVPALPPERAKSDKDRFDQLMKARVAHLEGRKPRANP